MSKNQHFKQFYAILANALVATVTNAFVWFAVTFWVYLGTRSVVATSLIAGAYTIANMASSLFFGAIVDHNKKKSVMLMSSIISGVAYVTAFGVYVLADLEAAGIGASPILWFFVVMLLLGSVVGNLRSIALSTIVPLLFAEGERDKANGLIGTTYGISFAITSVFSGLTIGLLGMEAALIIAITCTVIAGVHLLFVRIPEVTQHEKKKEEKKELDIRGTIAAIRLVPGLFALVFFTTFNNFLGGVFMALMDAYGLSLVSVQVWGFLWGGLSVAFIMGGLLIANFGLGKNPLRTMLRINMITWTICIFFTIQESIVLTTVGIFFWMLLGPYVEASEQTILQKVVPYERLGRVMGFAHSVESAASPITAFLIGPLTQFVFIPFMTTGMGVALIGDWFGTGPARGIARVFTAAGVIGLLVTLAAYHSRPYRMLSRTVVATDTN